MKSSGLKVGMELWKDREGDVYPDDDYFAYVEKVEITGIDRDVIWCTRQHLYFEGDVPTTDEDGWQRGTGSDTEKEILALGSGDDELEIHKSQWDNSWAENKFYTKQEIKRRVMNHLFEVWG